MSFDRVRELRAEVDGEEAARDRRPRRRSRAVRPGVRRQQPAVPVARAAALRPLAGAARPARRSPSAAASAAASEGRRRRPRSPPRSPPRSSTGRSAGRKSESRDTRENAARTLALLKPAGIDHIVLVTHGYHMPRALRAFTRSGRPGHQGRAGADGAGPRTRDAGARVAAELARLQRRCASCCASCSATPPAPERACAVAWHGSLALRLPLRDGRHDRPRPPRRAAARPESLHPEGGGLPQRAGASARRHRRRRHAGDRDRRSSAGAHALRDDARRDPLLSQRRRAGDADAARSAPRPAAGSNGCRSRPIAYSGCIAEQPRSASSSRPAPR